MDALDKLVAALDNYREARRRAPLPETMPAHPVLPTTLVNDRHVKADRAKAELRDALRAVVVEMVGDDYRNGGSLRAQLREDVAGVVRGGKPEGTPKP